MSILASVAGLTVSLFIGTSVFAAADGSVRGQITDRSGAVVATAHIHLEQLDPPHIAKATVTDEAGHFNVSRLLAGKYRLIVEHAGFSPVNREVQVSARDIVDLNVALEIGSVRQDVIVNGQAPSIGESPVGQTLSSIDRNDFKNTAAFTIAGALALAPGVTTLQGNGPRDVAISIRGSSERQTYGIRNAQVFEDGFPVTQPDGLSRTDLTDPHAYAGIDVARGPSSALYGNYATGGALLFHTRSGADLHGIDAGADFGSFGYFNDYLSFGNAGKRYAYSAFVSNVRGEGFTAHNNFNIVAANALASFQLTSRDRLTIKFINNLLDSDLSLRLSLNQYRQNPYQQDCAALEAAGCAKVTLFLNGISGPAQPTSPAQAGLGRHDRRTIAAARWEHDFSPQTTWRTQFVYDDRVINQPTGNSSYRGPYPSSNVSSDVTRTATLFGRPATSYAVISFNYEDIHSFVYNVAPGGRATLGALTQTVFGNHLNAGVRARQELALGNRWTAVLGLGGEYTNLQANQTNFSYLPAGIRANLIPAYRRFLNLAPEASLSLQATQAIRFHTRFGTGYGTPQATNLFVTPQGTFGNNTQLTTQKNTGVDFGAQWTAGSRFQLSATGFYEWFKDELVTQSAGVNLQSYTFNAPTSQHRGVELEASWRLFGDVLPGARLRASYLYDNQIYTRYAELLTSGSHSHTFNRAQKQIPGVIPQYLNARLLYEQPKGRLRGVGGFIETNIRDSFQLDNANLLQAPGYQLLNAELHYTPPESQGLLSRLHFYFEIENLTNARWIASAGNIANSLNAVTGAENSAGVLASATGSIYAGSPRASFGGVRVHF